MDETGAGSTFTLNASGEAWSPPEWKEGGDPPFLMDYDFSKFRND
jgi:hypothetical protein